ncbi:MAG: AAA domain-containing protein [Okeania sp. SIO2F4]|uniref:ATP-binding protein n=1 Tax=Okeania sp. SIO2F4 TaxID=2607790 RepID=UPI001429845A|nr:AAA family ATPase [Okeania sp. SIO2F4]NES01941.1 AAA domain-containing protein [Okeania sp. SIO2F4]
MNETSIVQKILPYTLLVGQEKLKLALELVYIAPRIGGVLLSGQRGTGKSTAVRAFSVMMEQKLPVTLPINATEDRVMGGWEISQLMESKAKWQDGLLKEAKDKLLYIDEVNLLDDHVVNIILDVTSTGVLVVQREGKRIEEAVSFTLVSTMNPEEGGLRPQLLDRFGLMVEIKAQTGKQERMKILQTVMEWDKAMFDLAQGNSSEYIDKARQEDETHKQKLNKARADFRQIEISERAIELCVELTAAFQAEGNRGDYVIALASRAYAALYGAKQVNMEHIQAVAQLVLQHRRPEFIQSTQLPWTEEDDNKVEEILNEVKSQKSEV